MLGYRLTEPFGCGALAPHPVTWIGLAPMSRTGGQEPVGYRIDNPIIPGRFIRNQLPPGGWVKTTVVGFLFIFDFSTFRGGLGKMAESRSPEKSAAREIVVW